MELTIELDDARAIMYEELQEELDEEVLHETMANLVRRKITRLYDNQDDIVRGGG